MAQSRLVALGVAMALSSSAAALAQPPPIDTDYRRLVARYAGGDHVASVVAVLRLSPQDIEPQALAALEEQAQEYERALQALRKSDDTTDAPPPARAYLRVLRAVAAMHLEAAVSLPPDRFSARLTHVRIAEAALRELDVSRDARWRSDVSVDAAARADVARFRQDWFVVAATHFQRRGGLTDALGFVGRALREFRDQPVFYVIEGSIFEALGTPIAAFDSTRAFVGIWPGEGGAARAAWQRAAESYQQALVLQPDDVEARIRLGRVSVLLGAFDAARRHLAADAPPGRLAYLLALGRGHAAEAQGRHDVALGHYREAGRMSDRWQSACIAVAHVLVTLGRRDEARGELRTCMAREPAVNDPWPAYAMGLEGLFAPTVRQLRSRVSGGTSAPHE